MADSGKKSHQLLGLFGCLGVMVVLFALLLGAAWFFLAQTEDQDHLTQEVEVRVTKTEKERRTTVGHTIDYVYKYEGEWFRDQDWITNTGWTPGYLLLACVDPDDPRHHVLRTRGDGECGEANYLDSSISTAEPVLEPAS